MHSFTECFFSLLRCFFEENKCLEARNGYGSVYVEAYVEARAPQLQNNMDELENVQIRSRGSMVFESS